ncbi:hypothetical protein NKH18_38920 [Streptomyces sp. M10(2022)]
MPVGDKKASQLVLRVFGTSCRFGQPDDAVGRGQQPDGVGQAVVRWGYPAVEQSPARAAASWTSQARSRARGAGGVDR